MLSNEQLNSIWRKAINDNTIPSYLLNKENFNEDTWITYLSKHAEYDDIPPSFVTFDFCVKYQEETNQLEKFLTKKHVEILTERKELEKLYMKYPTCMNFNDSDFDILVRVLVETPWIFNQTSCEKSLRWNLIRAVHMELPLLPAFIGLSERCTLNIRYPTHEQWLEVIEKYQNNQDALRVFITDLPPRLWTQGLADLVYGLDTVSHVHIPSCYRHVNTEDTNESTTKPSLKTLTFDQAMAIIRRDPTMYV